MVVMLLVTGVTVVASQKYLNKDDIVEIEPVEEDIDVEQLGEDFHETISFRKPDTMRGAMITPGVDFKIDGGELAVKEEISKALDDLRDYTLNTVVLNTNYEDQVIYSTADSKSYNTDFDIVEYIVEQGKDKGLFVYSTFDVSKYSSTITPTPLAINSGEFDPLYENLKEFAEKYEVDGILLEGYQKETTEESYGEYSKYGGGIGFSNYLKSSPEAIVQTGAKAIRKSNPSIMVGIIADPVWANEEDDQSGSKTKAEYTALNSGNSDTKSYIERGLLDFIVVANYGATSSESQPFNEVASWWGSLAHDYNTPLYIMQASSYVGSESPGWNNGDELVKQAIQLDEILGVKGNVFNSLAKLKENPHGSTDKLMKYYKEEVEPEYILTQLEMTKPAQTTYTTNEPQVVFTGASDPTEPVTINGNVVLTDQSGYFTATFDLSAGVNEFSIAHKDKTINYKITRELNILSEVSPTGVITTDGSMEITISAIAYENATVTATIGGRTINLAVDDSVVDEQVRDSSYKRYTGVYTAPPATSSPQSIGTVSITANWSGMTKTLQGATITVNKKAIIEDGVPVVVTVDQARTYPGSTLDDIPRADCYPLPKGAMDYAVGEEIVYKGEGYTMLASGLRVRSSDIQASSDYPSGNVVNGIAVDSKDGFTYVTLRTTQQVSYHVAYSANSFSVDLNYTNQVPSSMNLSNNPLFTSASWNGSMLTLPFVKQNGFMGYKAYYDSNGYLVLRFNNTPSSLSGARIAIDPGHGGQDTGALGFLADYPEKVINRAIAESLAAQLRSRGASVMLLDTSSGMELTSRLNQAESFNAHIFVSVHNNTAPNASAKGTEVYYFHPFSKALASSTSSNVSGQLGTSNRGAKQSYYRVTQSPQFLSVLVECGFMSNRSEYEKLVRSVYQDNIAAGIVDGISSAIATAYTGSSASGSQNTGGGVQVEDNQGETKVTLNRSTLNLGVNKNSTLVATVLPATQSQTVSWYSSNASVAAVSSSGVVTGKKAGTATITATSADGKTASCAVTVTGSSSGGTDTGKDPEDTNTGNANNDLKNASYIEIYDYNTTMIGGESQTLKIKTDSGKIIPNTEFKWTSSNTSIATVSSAGVVTASRTNGFAQIVVESTRYKDLYDVIDIDVSRTSTKITNINLNYSELAVATGATNKDLRASLTPNTATNSDVTWQSSNTSVATVDNQGNITGVRQGNATISCRAKNGSVAARCRVTVGKKVEVTDVYIWADTNSSNFQNLLVGENLQLKVEAYPSGASGTYKWESSNPLVLTVDSNGKITARRVGSATIKVTSTTDKYVYDELDFYVD